MSERIICNEAGGELREEVVRCRDCAYYASDEIGKRCTLMDFEDASGMADGFCAWGKRREEPTSDELLPCPFCGGEASIRLFYGGRYGVYCDCCDARVGGLYTEKAEAIAAWNRRADHD